MNQYVKNLVSHLLLFTTVMVSVKTFAGTIAEEQDWPEGSTLTLGNCLSEHDLKISILQPNKTGEFRNFSIPACHYVIWYGGRFGSLAKYKDDVAMEIYVRGKNSSVSLTNPSRLEGVIPGNNECHLINEISDAQTGGSARPPIRCVGTTTPPACPAPSECDELTWIDIEGDTADGHHEPQPPEPDPIIENQTTEATAANDEADETDLEAAVVLLDSAMAMSAIGQS